MLKLDDIQVSSYRTRTKHGFNGKECIRCGRQTDKTQLIEIDNGVGESQGWFPIGPECVKAAIKLGADVWRPTYPSPPSGLDSEGGNSLEP
jgi:hypothetical protein